MTNCIFYPIWYDRDLKPVIPAPWDPYPYPPRPNPNPNPNPNTYNIHTFLDDIKSIPFPF